MKKYEGFEDLEDVKKEFESECDDILEEEVLFASYGTQGYEGDAIVLIQRNGKLYTSEGSHCSCRGLEEQWELEDLVVGTANRHFRNRRNSMTIKGLRAWIGDDEELQMAQ